MAPGSICVAIPVRNGARYLPETIESVLAQSDVELAVHIVDNCSEDDSVAIARRYTSDDRIRVDVNEQDIGYYGSLNRILSEATTDYFVPFASDDVMLPGNLSRKLEALQATGAGMAHSQVLLIDEAGRPEGVWPGHPHPPVVDAPEFFLRIAPENYFHTQTAVVSCDALRAIGGFEGRSHYSSDWLTWMRLSLRLRVASLNVPFVGNRRHSRSGTTAYTGIQARDLPAALDWVFRDPAMPSRWMALHDELMATHLLELAPRLQRDGINRIEQGWSAYMAMGRRLAYVPSNPEAFTEYRRFVADAGLAPPGLPLDAVTLAPSSSADAVALGAAVDGLASRLARLLVCVHPAGVDDAMQRLEPVFADTALDVVLVPTSDALQHVTPGRIVLAPWGSELTAESEEHGVPVYPFALPNPFDRRPDPNLWETLDLTACLR